MWIQEKPGYRAQIARAIPNRRETSSCDKDTEAEPVHSARSGKVGPCVVLGGKQNLSSTTTRKDGQ